VSQRRMVFAHTPGGRAADTDNMTVRGGGDDISQLVEEVRMMIEDWRRLVMSCSWGALVISVQDCPDYPALLVTQ